MRATRSRVYAGLLEALPSLVWSRRQFLLVGARRGDIVRSRTRVLAGALAI